MMRHLRPEVLRLPRRLKPPREGLLNLSSNELLHPRVPSLLEQARAGIEASVLQRYPTYDGLLRELAGHYGVAPEQVLVSSGSDEAIRLLVEALAATTGRLVVLEPDYEGWGHYAALRGVAVRRVTFGEREPETFSFAALAEALVDSPPATVALSNPNAPTGAWFSQEQMRELVALCRRGEHLLVIDECYRDFCDVDHLALAAGQPHVVLVRTFSKSFGLAGARICSLVASPPVADYLARWRPEFPLSGHSIALLRVLLGLGEQLRAIHADIRGWRGWLASAVEERWPGWQALPSAANFVNFRTRSAEEAERAASRLLQRRIRIRKTDGLPGLERCIRFTVADPGTLQEVLQVLHQELAAER